MATPNAAELNALANDLATRYADATLEIRAGATVLATHTLAGFGAASGGTVTANAIADATIAATGIADNAKLIDGATEYDLTLGTSGTDVVVSTTNYISGETSSVNSLAITFA
ncbi:MAG: hypothetical protein VYC55_07880 [Pseudomonadota bacterium]|nr:hypothetical protein [Pseudomonadota bacterium]